MSSLFYQYLISFIIYVRHIIFFSIYQCYACSLNRFIIFTLQVTLLFEEFLGIQV
jgi:hypothetical protein